MIHRIEYGGYRMGKSQAQRLALEAMLDMGKRVCVVKSDGTAVIRSRVKRAGRTLDVIEPCRELKGFVSVNEFASISSIVPFAGTRKDETE